MTFENYISYLIVVKKQEIKYNVERIKCNVLEMIPEFEAKIFQQKKYFVKYNKQEYMRTEGRTLDFTICYKTTKKKGYM